jgi:hypothetical protein
MQSYEFEMVRAATDDRLARREQEAFSERSARQTRAGARRRSRNVLRAAWSRVGVSVGTVRMPGGTRAQ